MAKKMTVEKFAKMSFERDQEVGLYPFEMKFDKLDPEERDGYLDEAKYYIKEVSRENWPTDILERMKK